MKIDIRDNIDAFGVILRAGTVVYTGIKGIYYVPESTVRILDEKKIPYKELDN